MKGSGITVVFYLFGIKLRGQENSQGQIAFNYSKERSFGRLGRMVIIGAPDLKSGGRGFKSRSDHLAGVISR